MENNRNRIYKTIMLIVLTSFSTFLITIGLVNKLCTDSYYKTGIGFSEADEYIKEDYLSSFNSDENKKASKNLSNDLNKIKNTIYDYYLWNDQIDEDKLRTNAIKGFVSGLGDEYTEYIPKDEMEEYRENLSGSFTGIGIYMIADEDLGRVAVYYPIQGSPAEKAGIKAGDLIISVDGIEYTAADLNKIAKFIKGEQGTKVNLVVDRNGDKISFDIIREKINTNPINIRNLEGNIGYLKLPSFDEETSKGFEEKVKELEANGAKSLIIDLRNNGGGIVEEATDIADMFLEKNQTIISTVDNKGNKKVTYSKKDPIFSMPVVILVNENSASASEILVCCLKDNEKARIIGTKTFGKGIIQTVLSLSDGSGLKITTNEYYTPNGKNIHKIGIMPDEEVELPKTNENVYSVKEEDDTQLKRAIEVLKEKMK